MASHFSDWCSKGSKIDKKGLIDKPKRTGKKAKRKRRK